MIFSGKVLSARRRVALKTEGTVCPDGDRHRPVINIFIFPQENKVQALQYIPQGTRARSKNSTRLHDLQDPAVLEHQEKIKFDYNQARIKL